MRRRPKKTPGAGVVSLIEAGVPVGPLDQPNSYRQTGRGAKLHTDSDCNRLTRRNTSYAQPVQVDLLNTSDDAFCTECVTGPTSTVAMTYVIHARRVLSATKSLDQLRGFIAEDHDITGDGAEEGLDLSQVTRTTWHRVTQAKAVRQMVASVCDDPAVHPAMRSWADGAYRAAIDLHEHLHQLADSATDSGSIVRSCVVDLLGDLPSSGNPRKITAPVQDSKIYPALCTTMYSTRAAGFKDKVNDAWLAWSDQVKLTGDLAAARADAMAAGSVADLAPENVPQLPTGPARTPMPASGSPWEWLVAEWRLTATEELSAIIGEWEISYQAAVEASESEPAEVLGLSGWNLEARTSVNASTELLSHLPVVTDSAKEYGLVVVPGPVARWLEEFGLRGVRAKTHSWVTGTPAVVQLGPAVPGDGPEVFTTTLRMWEKSDSQRYAAPTPMRNLATALDVARGIHAGDAVTTAAQTA